MLKPQPVTISLRCAEDALFEPVTLEQAKLHARVDTDADDILVQSMIAAARQHAERQTGRVLRTSVWEWAVRLPLRGPVSIPVAPCSACAGVTANGEAVDDALYKFTPGGKGAHESPLLASLDFQPGFPASGEAVATLTAGWSPDEIPEAIRQWIRARVSTWYNQRETFAFGTNVHKLGYGFVDSLLDPYIIPRGL